MGKNKKKKNKDKKNKNEIRLECIMEQPVAKRLYISMLPLDNLLNEMRVEIDVGERDVEDAYYVRIQALREGLAQTLIDVLQDCNV